MSDSALRSAGFQERRDFPFSSLQHGFFLFFFPLPFIVTPLRVFILFFPPSYYYPPVVFFFFFCSPWVWLKVILRTGSLSERREREKGREGGERGRQKDRTECENSRARGSQAGRLSTVLCSHHFCFRHDWGSLEGHMGLQTVHEC